jgi:hypothetical protein
VLYVEVRRINCNECRNQVYTKGSARSDYCCRSTPYSASETSDILDEYCALGLSRPTKLLAPFGNITTRRMMFFDDITSGNGQDLPEPHYFTYNQAPVLPHAVVSARRDFPPRYSNFRSSHLYSASSSSRTAKSGHWSRMPPKRTSSGSPSGTPGKVVKTEQKPEDFSNSVKKRLQSSTRTGQACDRCKVRTLAITKDQLTCYTGP